MPLELAEASARRRAQAVELGDEHIDRNLRILLAHYQSVTADPKKMGHLHGLIAYYAKKPHPWKSCYQDNFKRFGPKTNALCGVLKDVIRQRTDWRGKNNPKDFGAPGVAIADSDAHAMHHLSDSNPGGGDMQLSDIPDDVWAIIDDLVNQCDPCRVIMGLDDPVRPSATFLEA